MKALGKTYMIIVLCLSAVIFLSSVGVSIAVGSINEQTYVVTIDDPKTQEMVTAIKNAGLSLHPAQYYESWEMKKRDAE